MKYKGIPVTFVRRAQSFLPRGRYVPQGRHFPSRSGSRRRFTKPSRQSFSRSLSADALTEFTQVDGFTRFCPNSLFRRDQRERSRERSLWSRRNGDVPLLACKS